MKLLIALSLLLAACSTVPVASTAWKSECGTMDEVAFCYHEVGQVDKAKQPILFNHGAGDSEKVFLNPTPIPSSYPEFIKAIPQGTRILAVSWGQAFILTNYPGRTLKPATATILRYKEILERLGERFKLSPPYRMVNHSMGSHNGAALALASPELFSKVALINGMLLKDNVDPWNRLQICPSCLLITPNYPNSKTYKEFRPKPRVGMPPLWVHACPSDIFNLYPGAEEYVLKARKLEINVQFIVPKGDCSHFRWSVPSLIKYLEN